MKFVDYSEIMNEYLHLDDLDRKILTILQKDASLGVNTLAEQVNASASSCWRRIRALEQAGVLGPHVRLVDPVALGRTLDVFCHVRMKSQGPRARASFQRAMEAEPTILAAYSVSGEWDYLLHLIVEDMQDYERILMGHVLDHESVAATSSNFVLRRVKHTTALPV